MYIENIKLYILNLIILIRENKLLSLIGIAAIVLIISSFTYGEKKITLKKKSIVRHSLISKRVTAVINKIPALSRIRDKIATNLALLTQKNSKTNKIYANNIITILIFFYTIISVISVIVFRFWFLKIIVPLVIISLTIFILVTLFNKKRNIAKRDFAEVISVFTTQYAVNLNVLKALQLSMYYIPRSHKYEFSRLITSMQSSEDYIAALDEYAQRIDYIMAYLFVEILKTNYIKNDNILYALVDLQNSISLEKKTLLQRTNTLKDKKSNIYFALVFIICAILIGIYLLEDYAINFYFKSFLGQLLLLLSVVVLVSVLLFMYVAEKSLQ